MPMDLDITPEQLATFLRENIRLEMTNHMGYGNHSEIAVKLYVKGIGDPVASDYVTIQEGERTYGL